VRRSVFALIAVLALLAAAPASAQLNDYKNNGSIPKCKFSDKQLGGALGDLPPDIEQYAPGYADELRNARGGGCGSGGGGSGSSGDGTTAGAQDRMQDVPAPGAAGGSSGGSGGAGGAGATSQVKVDQPPVPKPEKRTRLANVTSPAITSQPTGPDVPTWALVLAGLALLIGSAIGVLYLLGADFTRYTRPLGAAAGEARARTSDRALQLWETVRFGR
jgi:hypothetical protein